MFFTLLHLFVVAYRGVFRICKLLRFFKAGVMRNFAELISKHLCRNLFFDKVKLCRSAASLKTRL